MMRAISRLPGSGTSEAGHPGRNSVSRLRGQRPASWASAEDWAPQDALPCLHSMICLVLRG